MLPRCLAAVGCRPRPPGMPFQSIEPRRLYRQIADQIRGLIRAGEFGAGARLPPERDLAKQLGVSRPSVREALIALEVEGLVEVRIGSGIYVLAGNGAHDVSAANDATSGPFELLRARYVIESECAALAAKSAKRAQVAAIEGALDEMERERRDVGILEHIHGRRETIVESAGVPEIGNTS